MTTPAVIRLVYLDCKDGLAVRYEGRHGHQYGLPKIKRLQEATFDPGEDQEIETIEAFRNHAPRSKRTTKRKKD